VNGSGVDGRDELGDALGCDQKRTGRGKSDIETTGSLYPFSYPAYRCSTATNEPLCVNSLCSCVHAQVSTQSFVV